jgi:sulfur-oxidizing protein SoxB
MSMNRREFLQVMAVAAAGACRCTANWRWPRRRRQAVRPARFGNVSLLHMTDCHAQLLPIYFREPNVNLGIGDQFGKVPHLVGEQLLALRHPPGTPRPTPTPT